MPGRDSAQAGGEGPGAPPPVVFVPGLNNSAFVWRATIDNLPPGIIATAVDCPPLDRVDAVADALLADLPSRFVAVGHSFGGYVVLAMLAAAPERLAGVVLINSSDNADRPEQAITRREKAAEALDGAFEQMAMGRVDLVYHPDHAHDQQLLDERLAGVREYGAQRYFAHATACSYRPDRRALLTATTVPVLVVAADHDQVVPTEGQRAMAAAVDADLRIVGPAGHMLPAEQPKALATEIADWLSTR